MTTPTRTVRDAADAWLRRCKREGLDTQTIKTYRCQVETHVLPRLGDKPLADLRRADIVEFMEEMLDANSREMTRKVMVSLKSLLKVAVEREWIATSPAASVGLKRQSRHDEEVVVPTKEEIRRLLEHTPEQHKALITTAVFTGMRISELRGLPWEHVDFEKRIIRVRQRANKSNELGSPKSRAGRRDITMTPGVYEALKAWQPNCPKGPHDLVFPNGAGNIHNYGNLLRRVFKPIQVAAGIVDGAGEPKYGFHALRHFAASLMIEQGWPPKKIQDVLGHSSITVTYDVYGHLFRQAEKDLELFEKMEQDLMATEPA